MPAAPDFLSADFLPAVLAVSLTAILVVRPHYEPDGTTLTDFALEYLNPAGQRLTGWPEHPGGTARTRFPRPMATGLFEYYCRVFNTGELLPYEVYYQADGLDKYFRFQAQRCGQVLVVSFSDTADRDRSAAEQARHPAPEHARPAGDAALGATQAAAQERLERLFQQAPALVNIQTGPAHVFTLVHPLTYQLLGNRPLLGKPSREALPELEGPFHELLDQVYQTGEPYYGRAVPARLDRRGEGQLEDVYFDFTYQPFFAADGSVEGVMTFAVDVTSQVQARQQLEQLNHELEARVEERTRQLNQQQELLRQILRQVPASIATLSGPEHRYSFFNAPYQQLAAGRTALGRTVAEVFPEVVAQGFVDLLDGVYKTGEPFVGRAAPAQLYNATTGQPEPCYVDFVYQPLFDQHGQVQGILAFIVDVTQQVHARQESERLQAALLANAQQQARQREELYQVFEQAPVAVVLLRKPSHRIEYYNPAYAQLFPGLAQHGKPIAEAQPTIAEQGLVALLDGVFTTGTAHFGYEQLVTLPATPERPAYVRYLNFTYQAYREDGRIVGVAVFVYDVSEQVRSRQQVQELNEELAAINEELRATNEEMLDTNTQLTRTNAELDTFVYAASHDLKAPITNIEGLLDALWEYLPATGPEPMVPRLLTMMQGAVARFQQTVGYMTDVTRLQHSAADPAQVVNLGELVRDVRLDLAPLLESTQAQLHLELDQCPQVEFPARHLRSIVFNLLSNAVKYRHPARHPLVQLRAHCLAGQVVLEVQDNGLGLSEAQQQRLFGLFERLHDHVEGSGVGLYMVRKIVENAGGRITVQSQPGVGSTFTVTLPQKRFSS